MSKGSFHVHSERDPNLSRKPPKALGEQLVFEKNNNQPLQFSLLEIDGTGGLVWLEVDGQATGLDWIYAPFIPFAREIPLFFQEVT